MYFTFFAIGALIILALGVYAGKLMFLLQTQRQTQQRARQARIDSMVQSIQTIAFAMQQQQCNYSEGAIRICRLLESLPLDPLPDFANSYPNIHKLFDKVKDLPTHEARQALSKKERRAQDAAREQHESELESVMHDEIERLKTFHC